MDLQLAGRTALVTGGSGAIGQAIARTLAAEGAPVAIGWHNNPDPAADLVQSITAGGGRVCAVRLDQADPDTTAAGLRRVEAEFGSIDVLVAAAVSWPSLEPETRKSLADTLITNTVGTLSTVEGVLPGMRRRGWGRIVLISTDLVDQPMPYGTGYPAAKGAIEAAARVWAAREAGHGILTNVIRPGFTLTDTALTTPGLGQAAIDAESARTPTAHICTPDDVASAVTCLASGANGHINGEVLSIAGGRKLTR